MIVDSLDSMVLWLNTISKRSLDQLIVLIRVAMSICRFVVTTHLHNIDNVLELWLNSGSKHSVKQLVSWYSISMNASVCCDFFSC